MGRRGKASKLAAAVLLALLLGGVGSALGWSGDHSTRVRLVWSGRTLVDHVTPYADGYALIGVACPAQNLCLAVDGRGSVLRTANPAGGAQAWKPEAVSANGPISCPSTQLCVAPANGGLVVTTAPAGDAHAWQKIPLRGESGTGGQNAILDVSCPSSTLCLAIDTNDQAWISTNPAGGVSAWHRERHMLARPYDTLSGLSCASTQFCAALAFMGQLVTSSDPTGASGWQRRLIDQAAVAHGAYMSGIACPSAQLCVVVDSLGNVLSSTAPATGSWQAQALEPNHKLIGVSCPQTNLCFVFDDAGNVFASSDPTGGVGTWEKSQPLPNPHPPVGALTCLSAGGCVAVGYDGYASTTSDPLGGRWSGQRIDGYNALTAVSCTKSLCAAVDDAGDVLTSSDPAGGPGRWKAARIDASHKLTDISCPTSSLCVTVDSRGGVLSSSDPTGGAAVWHRAQVDTGHPLTTVACATAGGPKPVCVALADYPIEGLPTYSRDDPAGRTPGGADTIFTTSQPTGGSGAWHAAVLDPRGSGAEALDTAACPSARLCVVGDIQGDILSSTTPNGGPGAWREASLGHQGASSITGTSCPSTRLCVLVDNNGIVLASTEPAGGTKSWRVEVPGGFEHVYPGDVLCPSTNLCIADTVAASYTSTDPTGGMRAWPISPRLPVPPPAIACRPQTRMCVAAVGEGYIRTSH